MAFHFNWLVWQQNIIIEKNRYFKRKAVCVALFHVNTSRRATAGRGNTGPSFLPKSAK